MSAPRFLVFASTSAVTGCASALLLACLARFLPTKEYGHFGLMLSFALVANVVLFQWVRLYFMRFSLVRSAEVRRRVLSVASVAFLISGAVASFVAVLVLLYEWLIDTSIPISPLAVLGLALTQAAYELGLAYFRSNDDDSGFLKLSVSRAVCYLLLGSLAAYTLRAHIAVSFALMVSYLVVFAFLRQEFAQVAWQRFQQVDREELVRAAKYALPMSASMAIVAFVPAMGRLAISMRGGDIDLASLVLSWDVCSLVVSTLALSANFVFYNRIVQEFEEGNLLQLRATFRSHVSLLSGLIFVAWIGSLLFGEIVFKLAAGGELGGMAAPYTPWAILVVSLISLRQFWFDHVFMLKKRTKVLAVLNGVGLCVSALMLALPFSDPVRSVYISLAIGQGSVLLIGILYERRFFMSVMSPVMPLLAVVIMSSAAVLSSL